MSPDRRWGLFAVYGVEMEYMIVDRESLDVRPVADLLLQQEAGSEDFVQDLERGAFGWSNELVSHVVEFKTNGPVPGLSGLSRGFAEEVRQANTRLGPHGAMLLGTGAHPWMDPDRETRLWPHGDREIYQQYDRIFGCRGHGWSNLQSVHLNLPFAGDEQFGRLHAAVRLVLPLIPALTASTPVLDGRVTGYLDTRLETYRHNQDRVPSIAGRVIPERVWTEADYRLRIFDRIRQDIEPHDPDHVLRTVFLNSRGAIARFDRGAIEIRVIDIQECPAADLAALDLVVALLKALVEERCAPLAEQQAWPEDLLADIFLAVIRDAEATPVADPEFLRMFGLRGRRMSAGRAWRELARDLAPGLDPASRRPLSLILDSGPLARRILGALGSNPGRPALARVWRELASCLADNRSYP